MDIVKIPIGSDASLSLSISGGNAVLNIVVAARAPIDMLLEDIKAKLPAALQPVVEAIKVGVDAELGMP